MTKTPMDQAAEQNDVRGFVASLAPRLPRMLAVTSVVVFSAFAGIQFLPQTFEAQLALGLPADSEPQIEAARLIDQEQLGDVVSRLSPDIIAELRNNGGGVLDTTTLLRQRLSLTSSDDGTALHLAARAGTPARARAIVEALAASHLAAAIPPALPETPAVEDLAEAAPVIIPSSDEDVKLLQQRLSLAWEDRVKLENRARRIESLIADGNYAMLALDAENLPGLGRKMDDLAELEAERERLEVNYLPNHPTMRTLREKIDQLSSDLSIGVQNLSELVIADRDAARRLEDGLRDELAAAMIPAVADTSMATGAIGGKPETIVVALPRPVRTDLTLAFAGGLAFFGQIGLLALLRPRQPRIEEAEAFEPSLSPVEQDFEPAAPQDHNWLSAMPQVSVEAEWQEEPVEQPATKAAPRTVSNTTLDDVSVIAIRARGDQGAGARKLLAYYEQQDKRVALVDAASRRRGRVPGITDLARGNASFADVIHGSGRYEVAFVPWGRENQLDPSSKRVGVLVVALAELYDVVILSIDGDNLAASAPLAALADLTIEADAVPAATKRAA